MGKKMRRIFAPILSFLLIFSMFFSPISTSFALSKGVNVSAKDSGINDVKNKIDAKLLNEFRKLDQVTFLVKFKQQADTTTVAKKAEEKAEKENLTPSRKKLFVRSNVITELKSTALTSQQNVLDFLEKEKKNGTVKHFESFYIVNGIAVTASKEVMEKIATFPEVEKLLPNEKRMIYPVEVVKDKTKISNIEWNIDRIGAPSVWQMGIDGSGIVVGTIDTGIEWDHPALKEKYLGYNPLTGEVNHEGNFFDAVNGRTDAYDDQGHGTHVAGTIVGSESDGSNQIGVAPGAKIIAAKAFSASGTGSDADILAAGEWILEQAPDVVSNSWGGGPGLDEWYRPMVTNWRNAGIVPVFAAGNADLTTPQEPGSVSAPGNYPESFAVGATDSNDNLASFSLLGPSPYGEIKPDVSAPGVGIRSSYPGSSYASASGTSMATPHVSGAVALLLQANHQLSVDEVEQILMETATPMTNEDYPDTPNNAFGYGIIDVYSAVSSVASGIGTIKGQVTTGGEDTEAPIIDHESIDSAYAGIPLTVQTVVTDDVSVVQVSLEYENAAGKSETLIANQLEGDYQSGVFEVTILGEDVVEGDLVYRLKAVDFGGNEATTEDFTITVQPLPTVGYFQDFETDISGWNMYGENNTWEWGVPTSGPGEAFSGEKLVGTNLDGQYENSSYSSLETIPFVIPEDGIAYLQFTHWFNIETNWDNGYVFISSDGGQTWDHQMTVTGTSGSWMESQIDLSAYAGETILVAFDLETDSSVTRDGWYIDDVRISDTALNEVGKIVLEETVTKKGVAKPVTHKERPKMQKTNGNKNGLFNDKKIMDLPLAATVTALESGRSVNTNPADGSYSMMHGEGEVTLLAESYGFYPATQQVTVVDGEEVIANFLLEALPSGTISGTITNSQTGEPIEGATVFLVEDANVDPVVTGEDGSYQLTAFEGEYTLKVVAPRYHSKDVTVNIEGDRNVEVHVALDPFIGYPGEIGYDDGTPENARAFYDAGNGWAVKMSLAEGNDRALVTGGLFRFWDTEWPIPGGTDFQVAVYGVNEAGEPGDLLAGPIDATALRDGNWTYVDLSSYGIVVEGDFYLAYIQSAPYPNSPGLATDESSPNSERNWQFVGGTWSPTPVEEGNYMIRAIVEYEVTAPVISTDLESEYTNMDSVTITGVTAPNMNVHIFNNGEEETIVESTEDGTFSAEISLDEGENTIFAKVSSEQGYTPPSNEIFIVYDPVAPELTIDSPSPGEKFNKEVITVSGTVSDDYLATVFVNGREANIEDGTYSARVIVDEGENIITVVAKDFAGNETTKTVTVDVDYTPPVIENILPTEDVDLSAGETVLIQYTSEPGLIATFMIKMPLTNLPDIQGEISEAYELPMMEISPGTYVGYYTATSDVVVEGALVEVIAKDQYGNISTGLAQGKLNINVHAEDDGNGKGKDKRKGKDKGKGKGKGKGKRKGRP